MKKKSTAKKSKSNNFNFKMSKKTKQKLTVFCVLAAICIALFFVLINFADKKVEKIVHTNSEMKVPDVSGLTFDEAKVKLAKENLNIKRDEDIVDKKTKKGLVVLQVPSANTIVRKGRTIRVSLSSGKHGLEMPNVVGMKRRNAEITIKNMGLIIGQEENIYSTSTDEGKIISQSPQAFSATTRGSFVSLKISKGLPPDGMKLMPKIMHQKKEVAEILLSNSALDYKFEYKKTKHESEIGLVIEQSPDADEEVEDGQTVIATIGQ